jgi:hydroxymethylpyrimidine pyrophosphatase-like HAD family hydrolase
MRAVARPPVLLVEPAGSPADIVMDRALLHLPVYRRYAEQHAGFVVVEDNLSHSPLLTRVLGMFLCEPLDKINDLRAHLTDVLGDLIEHRSLDNLEYIPDHRILEILEPGHTKWNGIEQLCEALQLDDAYVIAFGDDHNDLDMLTGADLSFAPRNAIQAAKQAADDVIPSNNDDGVALTLRRLFAGIFA